jgi:hypothetical protein
MYVDNLLIIEKEEIVENLIDDLRNHEINLKFKRIVNEYLSCCIEESNYE